MVHNIFGLYETFVRKKIIRKLLYELKFLRRNIYTNLGIVSIYIYKVFLNITFY